MISNTWDHEYEIITSKSIETPSNLLRENRSSSVCQATENVLYPYHRHPSVSEDNGSVPPSLST